MDRRELDRFKGVLLEKRGQLAVDNTAGSPVSAEAHAGSQRFADWEELIFQLTK